MRNCWESAIEGRRQTVNAIASLPPFPSPSRRAGYPPSTDNRRPVRFCLLRHLNFGINKRRTQISGWNRQASLQRCSKFF